MPEQIPDQAVVHVCPRCGRESRFPPGTPAPYCFQCDRAYGIAPGGRNVMIEPPDKTEADKT